MSSSGIIPRPDSDVLRGGDTKILSLGTTEPKLDNAPADLTREDLVGLLLTEIRRSYHDGHPTAVDHFRPWLERLNATSEDWLTLITLELELRLQFGPPPIVDDYVSRFPALAGQILQAFESAMRPKPAAKHQNHPGQSVLSLFSPSRRATVMQPAIDLMVARQDITVPGYEIIGVLGRGGMGVVYKARHVGLNRLVALKMVLAGSHANEEDLARFRLEAEAVAALRHPNIVQLYEIGEHHGTPYFSMEYVEGGTLAKRIAEQPPSSAFAAEIAETLARAIHAAHLQNIIHRDLKPANVLLAAAVGDLATGGQFVQNADTNDNKRRQTTARFGKARSPAPTQRAPAVGAATVIPKITDFGLAKRLDNSLQLTVSGLVAGTPEYMAPEQVAASRRHKLGPAVDVYAIGVILYEMLTGRPPFVGSGPAELMRQVLHQEPLSVRQLQPNTPRDLETICLKCLQKDPTHRYASAEKLADDLKRFRNSEAIQARPVGKLAQSVRWCRRNPAVASLLLAISLTLFAGTGAASLFAVSAADHAREAEENEREARRQELAAEQAADALRNEKGAVEEARRLLSIANADLTKALGKVEAARREEERLKKDAEERDKHRARELFDAQMIQAQRAWETGHVGHTRSLLAAYEPVRHDLPDHRGFEWHYLDRLGNADGQLFTVPDGCRSVAVSPDGKEIIWASRNVCEIWGPTDRPARLAVLGSDAREAHRDAIERVAYDPTGKFIATGSRDKTVKIWNASTRRLIHTFSTGEYGARGVRFSPDGKHLAAALSDAYPFVLPGALRVWNVQTGETEWSILGHASAIFDLSWSADGMLIATAGHDECVKIWNAATGKGVITLPMPKATPARSVAFAPHGPLLAAGNARGEILLWNRDTWTEERRLRGHVNWVSAVAFSADGKALASASRDQLLKIWDPATGEERRTFRGHTQALLDVAWQPGQPCVFTSSADESIKRWDIARDPESFTIASDVGVLANLHVLPDGRRIAVAAVKGTVGVWNSETARPATEAASQSGDVPIWDSSLAPDGLSMAYVRASATDDAHGDVWTWNFINGKPHLLELAGLAKGVHRVAYSSDGKFLATGHNDGTVQVHFLDQKKAPVAWKIPGRTIIGVSFPPGDASRLLVLAQDMAPMLYEVETPAVVQKFAGHFTPPHAAAFSADGKWLATGSPDRTACVWDVETGRLAFKLEGHTGPVGCVAFSPDNRRLLTGSNDFTLKLWDLQTGQETLTLRGHTRLVTHAFFSPDGSRIFSTGLDSTVHVWNGAPDRDREILRAAAAACRLTTFHVDGDLRTGQQIAVKFELANVTGQAWPLPERKGTSKKRLVVRLIAKPINKDRVLSDTENVLGRWEFNPDRTIDVDYRWTGQFDATLKNLPAGKYRFHLEHAWVGDEILTISEKSIEATIARDPNAPRPDRELEN